MKSKTVCFFRPSPIFTNFSGLHLRVNGCYKHHPPLTTTLKFENLHVLATKKARWPHAFTGCETYSSPVLAKKKSV